MIRVPQNLKFKKSHKLFSWKGNKRGANMTYGRFSIRALENGLLTLKEIETVRRMLVRPLKALLKGTKEKRSLMITRVTPSFPLTKKPSQVRMGKGKGNPYQWVCHVRKGKILFEILDIPAIRKNFAKRIFSRVFYKLPIRVKFSFIIDIEKSILRKKYSSERKDKIMPKTLIALRHIYDYSRNIKRSA